MRGSAFPARIACVAWVDIVPGPLICQPDFRSLFPALLVPSAPLLAYLSGALPALPPCVLNSLLLVRQVALALLLLSYLWVLIGHTGYYALENKR